MTNSDVILSLTNDNITKYGRQEQALSGFNINTGDDNEILTSCLHYFQVVWVPLVPKHSPGGLETDQWNYRDTVCNDIGRVHVLCRAQEKTFVPMLAYTVYPRLSGYIYACSKETSHEKHYHTNLWVSGFLLFKRCLQLRNQWWGRDRSTNVLHSEICCHMSLSAKVMGCERLVFEAHKPFATYSTKQMAAMTSNLYDVPLRVSVCPLRELNEIGWFSMQVMSRQLCAHVQTVCIRAQSLVPILKTEDYRPY